MAHEAEITVDQDGNVEIDLKNYHGKGCSEVADAFAKALGKKVKEKNKAEFYETDVCQKQKVKQNGF